jgi:UDP-N-acetyl-D-glucosamine dehydrogenase
MKISVIGQGYVGLTVAIGAAGAGHTVIGFDINKDLVLELKQGITHVPGVESSELISLIDKKIYTPTNDNTNLIGSEIVVIAVPTPLDINKNPDLKYLEDASTLVAKTLTSDTLIINESTSFPGTLRQLIKPIFDKKNKFSFEFASAPERVDPANSDWVLKNTPRIIGGLTEKAADKAASFYKSFCDEVHVVSCPEVAEAAKLFENTFRQVNIALVNEFAKVTNSLGFSTHEAINAAATKPFGFMPFYPSIGVGGHCIPVDPTYLSYSADRNQVETEFIKLANKTNLEMVDFIVSRISTELNGNLKGARIQVVGIAYKPDVADLRESPAITLIKKLNELGASITWFDQLVVSDLPGRSTNLDLNIDLGLIVTPHSDIDFSIWKDKDVKVLDLSATKKDYGWPKYL